MNTIDQFGAQFSRYPTTQMNGSLGDASHLMDTFGPLMPDVSGAHVVDIGSGPGRVVNMLLDLGASHVTALEPSDAFKHLLLNTQPRKDRITFLNFKGDALPPPGVGDNYDFIFSVGVLHHIADPAPVVSAAYKQLKSGGQLLVWLYAHEGNESYLRLARPLRILTVHLPDSILAVASNTLNALLTPYVWLCRAFPLPRYRHFREVFGKMNWSQRTLVIFDQLNPSDAKYYTKEEARQLLSQAGFVNIGLYHRHGYSWSISGTKPTT